MSLLDVQGLVSQFSTPTGPINAVDDVSLTVEAGEILCLVGESGCGKTAFGTSIVGLMPAGRAAHPAGRILFDGRDLMTLRERDWQQVRGRDIGMIFQEPMTSLNPVMRIGDQVAEPLLVHGIADRKEAAERAVQALASVGIPGPAQIVRQYPHQLSGGMRQRVMIAIAMIAGPRLLIADEPTTALDVTIEAQILQLIRDMRDANGTAVLFVTHDLGVVAEIGDRLAVMYAGQIVEQGPVAEVFATPRHPYTQGLLASMPRPGQGKGRLQAIPGTVPQPHARPVGCRFQPRCSYGTDACLQPINIEDLDDTRRVRCIHHDQLVQGSGES